MPLQKSLSFNVLAAAVGPNLTKLLHDELDLTSASGLSGPLVSATHRYCKTHTTPSQNPARYVEFSPDPDKSAYNSIL